MTETDISVMNTTGAAWQETCPSRALTDRYRCPEGFAARIAVPFDANEVIDALRHERYMGQTTSYPAAPSPILSGLYYHLVRPVVPSALRTALQRLYLRGWEDISFPRWPVDLTVEDVHETLLTLLRLFHPK